MSETEIDWTTHFRDHMGADLLKYARDRWAYSQPVWQLIQRRFPTGARILEFGSGTGIYGAMLARFGYDVTGVDINEEMLNMARQNAAELGATSIRFERASILDLHEYHDRFDLAYSSGVIEHFYHPQAVRAVREASRCAPEVFVLVPSKWAWRVEAPRTEGIFECYTMGRLRSVVREAGLRIVEEVGFSAGNRVGRAIELLCPPLLAPPIFKHFAATIGILARRR